MYDGSHTRPLVVFLAGSIAAHAAVLGMLPGFTHSVERPTPPLEVRLEQPAPLPVAPLAQELPPPPKRKAQHLPAPAAPDQPERYQPAPVLALPATPTPEASAFTVPAPAAAPASGTIAGEKGQVAGAAVTPPAYGAAYLRNPPPAYPATARRNGVQGTVMLKVVVTREGLPARVDLEHSSGSMHLDHAALEAVRGWRCVPARRGSEAVEGVVTFPLVFRLENG